MRKVRVVCSVLDIAAHMELIYKSYLYTIVSSIITRRPYTSEAAPINGDAINWRKENRDPIIPTTNIYIHKYSGERLESFNYNTLFHITNKCFNLSSSNLLQVTLPVCWTHINHTTFTLGY